MIETLQGKQSITEKAAWIQEHGRLIAAQDYYSFFTLVYLVDEEHIKLVFDCSGTLVTIEGDEETPPSAFLANQLESLLDR